MPVSDDTAEYVPLVDWSEGEEMATDAENASTALSNRLARLAEVDAVPLSQRIMVTYTDTNGRTVGWTAYRAQLVSEIEALQGKGNDPGIVQKAGGPFTVYG